MSFDGAAFIHHVAERLVHEFQFAAGAGTPGLVGAAKEHPARKQLERLMPGGVSIGSGIIVDSYGGTSRQQDIILYENLCPIFTHNDAAEATYFPVEGVIAAGEVKSRLGKTELQDAIAKSVSVKSLRRHAIANEGLFGEAAVSFRHYCSGLAMDGTIEEQFDQDRKSIDQIFTFALCQRFSSSAKCTIENTIEEFRHQSIGLMPNMIVSLEDGFIAPHITSKNSIVRSPMDGDGLIFCAQPREGFGQLLGMLRLYAIRGRTVERGHFERYFRSIAKEGPSFAINSHMLF